MSILDTPQPIVTSTPASTSRPDLLRGERGTISFDKIQSSGAAEREQRPNVSRPPDIPGGFDFHLAVYAIF